MTRLVLGTAQFGAGYGITNHSGRLSDEEVRAILDVAAAAEVDLFDTAPDYNDAQERLGRLGDSSGRPGFVSKFGLAGAGGLADADALIGRSLADLGVSKLYGLLFHRPADLRDERSAAVWDELRRARDHGVIERIGASIYDLEDLEILAERFPEVSLVQVPGNILDRRLIDHPGLGELRASGVEVHVRSVYLQGLLLTDPAHLSGHFAAMRPALADLHAAAERLGATALGVALRFLRNHPMADGVLVGATSASELAATVDEWAMVDDAAPEFVAPELSADLLDPRLWPPRGGNS